MKILDIFRKKEVWIDLTKKDEKVECEVYF